MAEFHARQEDVRRFRECILKVSMAYGVPRKDAFRMLLDHFEAHQHQLQERLIEKDTWVPIAPILEVDRIPAGAAKIIGMALDEMEDQEIVGPKNRWQGLELLAADFLAGNTTNGGHSG